MVDGILAIKVGSPYFNVNNQKHYEDFLQLVEEEAVDMANRDKEDLQDCFTSEPLILKTEADGEKEEELLKRNVLGELYL